MILQTCTAIAMRCRGVWAYLVRRETRRQAVETHREDRLRDIELEQARNAGTKSVVEALASGGQVVEIEPGGRSRVVWMPERQSPSPIRRVVEREEDHSLESVAQRGRMAP